MWPRSTVRKFDNDIVPLCARPSGTTIQSITYMTKAPKERAEPHRMIPSRREAIHQQRAERSPAYANDEIQDEAEPAETHPPE